MRNLFLGAAMVAAAWLMPAMADGLRTPSEIRNPSMPLVSLHAEALIPILAQMGFQYEGVTLPAGEKALLVRTQDGRKFQITPMACSEDGRCRGMHLLAVFEAAVDRRTVQAFNDRYAFVSAGLSDDRTAYLSRYEIADFGMARGNVAVSITVFLETAQLFKEHLLAAAGGLQQAPLASDLAAASLNRAALAQSAALGLTVGAAPASPHAHADSFETTDSIARTFVRAEQYYPGRIVNHVGDGPAK